MKTEFFNRGLPDVVPDRLLPMLAVEGVGTDVCQVDAVEAADFDAELVGIRARHVEGVNAAMPAEGVLGGSRVELVGRELVLAAQQLEPFRRHDEMQKAFLGADRAIALGDVREVRSDAKANAAAMAAPFEHSHALHPFMNSRRCADHTTALDDAVVRRPSVLRGGAARGPRSDCRTWAARHRAATKPRGTDRNGNRGTPSRFNGRPPPTGAPALNGKPLLISVAALAGAL